MTSAIVGARPRMNRLDRRAANGRPLLACYFAMGDPLFDDAVRDIYVRNGVDIVELGIPAADPFLDGPDIAGAMARALAGPIDPYTRMADMVSWLGMDAEGPAGVCMAYADIDIPTIDPATLDGLDGFLIVGLADGPDRERLRRFGAEHAVRDCGFVPLRFRPDQAAEAARCDGYVMMQAASGVTGPRETLDAGLREAIAGLRGAGVDRPILAGFGIGTAAQARAAVDLGADGVVIGSMCVRKVQEGPAAIRSFLRDVREALDAG